jgi:hypothetical protein
VGKLIVHLIVLVNYNSECNVQMQSLTKTECNATNVLS